MEKYNYYGTGRNDEMWKVYKDKPLPDDINKDAFDLITKMENLCNNEEDGIFQVALKEYKAIIKNAQDNKSYGQADLFFQIQNALSFHFMFGIIVRLENTRWPDAWNWEQTKNKMRKLYGGDLVIVPSFTHSNHNSRLSMQRIRGGVHNVKTF